MAKDKKNKSTQKGAKDVKKPLKPSTNKKTKTPQAFESLSRNELVDLAKKLKIKNYSRLSKAELVKMISQANDIGSETEKSLKKEDKKTVPIVDLSGVKKFKAPERDIEEEMVLDIDKEARDFNSLSREELVNIAKDLKIKNYSRLNKTRLIKLISETKNAPTFTKEKKSSKKDKKPVKISLSSKIKVSKKKAEAPSETKKMDQAELIESIAQHYKSPYADERSPEEERKAKLLLKPSKFPKGKINKEFLLEGEENIELPEIFEENKIVLLPIDPYRIFTYWNLNSDTIKMIRQLNINQFVLKVNDVTNIIYNGRNAHHYWFETCLPFAKNWYINLLDGDKNLNIELGYVLNGNFYIIATSNTIYVPRRYPSNIINDKFVIVTYPQVLSQKSKKDFISPTEKTKPYFRFDNRPFFENKPVVSPQMPGFPFQKDVTPSYGYFEKGYETPVTPDTSSAVSTPTEFPFSQQVSYAEPNKSAESTGEEIPQTDLEQFENYFSVKDGKIIIDRYYYEIPGYEHRVIKVMYEWYKDGIPYRKEFYWSTGMMPVIHEKIYKISWGPSWVKEFIGGSEHIRFLGASERFLGASERFFGGSEMFLGASGRFMGASEMFYGGSDSFMGASEIYFGGRDRFMGPRERYAGASEHFLGGSDMMFMGRKI